MTRRRAARLALRLRSACGLIGRTAATAAVLLLLGAAPAGAVQIAQHAIPKLTPEETVSPATDIFDGPQGLLVSGARAGSYQTVDTGARFAVGAGVGNSGTARSFFLGPDGSTWYLGFAQVPAGEKQVTVSQLDRVGAAGPEPVFTFPSAASFPLFAATGPDGAVWLTETTAGSVDRFAPGVGTVAFPMPVSTAGPAQIAAGPGGELWTADVVTGAIAEISPDGSIREHRLPGGGFGRFGNTGPSDVIAGPDGAAWFTEQNGAAVGRITPGGEVQTFPIPALTGAIPGGTGWPAPRSLAVGPEGGIWFTDPGTNSVGRVLGGQVSEYSIPTTTPVVPAEIATAGGKLWFTEAASPSLGSVDPSAPARQPAPAPPRVSTAQVADALCGSAGHVGRTALLRSGVCRSKTTFPAAGTVSVVWTATNHVVVARGRASAATASAGVAVLTRLTAAGRRLIARRRSLTVRASGVVLLAGAAPVRASGRLTISG